MKLTNAEIINLIYSLLSKDDMNLIIMFLNKDCKVNVGLEITNEFINSNIFANDYYISYNEKNWL